MKRTLSIWVRTFAILAAFAPPLSAQTAQPTAAQLTARILKQSGVTLPTPTVDTFKSGDPNTKVRGITVTMMATLDVLKRAVANGDNFIITHEPTFYTSRDTLAVLESEDDSMLMAAPPLASVP